MNKDAAVQICRQGPRPSLGGRNAPSRGEGRARPGLAAGRASRNGGRT